MANWCSNLIRFTSNDNANDLFTAVEKLNQKKIDGSDMKLDILGLINHYESANGLPLTVKDDDRLPEVDCVYVHHSERDLLTTLVPQRDGEWYMSIDFPCGCPESALSALFKVYKITARVVSEEPANNVFEVREYLNGDLVNTVDKLPVITKHVKRYCLRHMREVRKIASLLSKDTGTKYGHEASKIISRAIKKYKQRDKRGLGSLPYSHYRFCYSNEAVLNTFITDEYFDKLHSRVQTTILFANQYVLDQTGKEAVYQPNLTEWESLN